LLRYTFVVHGPCRIGFSDVWRPWAAVSYLALHCPASIQIMALLLSTRRANDTLGHSSRILIFYVFLRFGVYFMFNISTGQWFEFCCPNCTDSASRHWTDSVLLRTLSCF